MDKLESRVKQIISEHTGIALEDINENLTFREDFRMSPSDIGDLMDSLKQELEIEFPEEEVGQIKTVGDLIDFVQRNGQEF